MIQYDILFDDGSTSWCVQFFEYSTIKIVVTGEIKEPKQPSSIKFGDCVGIFFLSLFQIVDVRADRSFRFVLQRNERYNTSTWKIVSLYTTVKHCQQFHYFTIKTTERERGEATNENPNHPYPSTGTSGC